MVPGFVFQITNGTKGAKLGVGATKNNVRDAGLDGGAKAHGAGFTGGNEDGVGEAPGILGFAGLGDGLDFCVSGGVLGLFFLIVASADDLVGFDIKNDGANGNFFFIKSFFGF